MRLSIDRDFRGDPLPKSHCATVEARLLGDELVVEVDAPYFADPPPPSQAGVYDELWEHEVVELFLADAGEHYLEIELGPHGHHLVIELRGVRNKQRVGLPIRYDVQLALDSSACAADEVRGRFLGTARIPSAYLSMQVVRANAYAIHGTGHSRRYCAHAPMGGTAPDFHDLSCFVACAL